MNNVAQSAIEYLLAIGTVILIVAIAIFWILSITQMGQIQTDSIGVVKADYPIKQQLASARGEIYLPSGVPILVKYVGTEAITVGELKTMLGSGVEVTLVTAQVQAESQQKINRISFSKLSFASSDETVITIGNTLILTSTSGDLSVSNLGNILEVIGPSSWSSNVVDSNSGSGVDNNNPVVLMDGTKEHPWRVTNCTELQNIDLNLNQNYVLANDIDCSGVSNFRPIGREGVCTFSFTGGDLDYCLQNSWDCANSIYDYFCWTSENQCTVECGGNWTANEAPFTGNFDGAGHTISNLSINYPWTFDATANVKIHGAGLFGYVAGGEISNVKMINVNVSGSRNVGGLVGTFKGKIINSSFNGTVSGSSAVGGMVGYLDGGEVSKSFSSGSVNANGSEGLMGGLIGYAFNGNVSNSYSTASVNSSGDNVGGFIGSQSGSNISNCYSVGLVSGGGSSGIGGFLGRSYSGSVSGSYWDTVSSRQSVSAGGTGVFGKTTEQMKQQSTYVGWNFDTIWGISANEYPSLTKHISCTGPDGVIIPNAGSKIYYALSSVTYPQICAFEVRSCNEGVLSSGSYTYGSCTVLGNVNLLNECTNITSPGTYVVNANLESVDKNVACITVVGTNNVVLDFAGHTIEDNSSIENTTVPTQYSFLITDCQGLQDMRNNPNGNYVLAKDVDCSGISFSGIPEFYGTLDGAGHKILNFNTTNYYNSSPYFIGTLYGTLKNVVFAGTISVPYELISQVGLFTGDSARVSNVYFNSLNNVGTGPIEFNCATVENSYSDFRLTFNAQGRSGGNPLGGLVANNAGSGSCYGGIVNSYSASGGLVGFNGQAGFVNGTIINSSYGGSGPCVGEGSASGCTYQALPAPVFTPKKVTAGVLIVDSNNVVLKNIGTITNFGKDLIAKDSRSIKFSLDSIQKLGALNSTIEVVVNDMNLEFINPIKTSFYSDTLLSDLIKVEKKLYDHYTFKVDSNTEPGLSSPVHAYFNFSTSGNASLLYNGVPVSSTSVGTILSENPLSVEVNTSTPGTWSALTARCGNDVAQPPDENCDGVDLYSNQCWSIVNPVTNSYFDGGTLDCYPPTDVNACKYNTTGCYWCGNGRVEPGEECDNNTISGTAVFGEGIDCSRFGFTSGMPYCGGNCRVEVGGCTCNNNSVCENRLGEDEVNCPADCCLHSFNLAWDESPDTNVVGYVLYSGKSSRNYDRNIAFAKRGSDMNCFILNGVPTCTVSAYNYLSDTNHFFAVTAYSAEGVQSEFSNELELRAPNCENTGLLIVSPVGSESCSIMGGGSDSLNRPINYKYKPRVPGTYILQRALSLTAPVSWETVQSVTVTTTVEISLTDPSGFACKSAYYRVAQVTP